MTVKSFTLAVYAAAHLPTVLAGTALRVPQFTVSKVGDGWHLTINNLDQDRTCALLDALPAHMVCVHEIEP
jgi:hypothetical protein